MMFYNFWIRLQKKKKKSDKLNNKSYSQRSAYIIDGAFNKQENK